MLVLFILYWLMFLLFDIASWYTCILPSLTFDVPVKDSARFVFWFGFYGRVLDVLACFGRPGSDLLQPKGLSFLQKMVHAIIGVGVGKMANAAPHLDLRKYQHNREMGACRWVHGWGFGKRLCAAWGPPVWGGPVSAIRVGPRKNYYGWE